jgi:hypothetical protein
MFFKKKKPVGGLIKEFSKNIKYIQETVEKGKDFSESYFDSDMTLVNTLEKNFNRLVERYKFNETKLTQILFDSVEYVNIIEESIISRGIDHSEYDKIMEPLWLKREEIEKRFKQLLGEEYLDGYKIFNELS